MAHKKWNTHALRRSGNINHCC